MDNSGGSDPDIQYHESTSSSDQPGQPSQDGSRGIIGRLVRRLPRILLLWLLVSMAGVYLVHLLIEPTYESTSTLRIEPSPDLFGPSIRGDDAPGFGQYLETQRALILSNLVLEPEFVKVCQIPGYNPSAFPILAKSTDPKTDVRRRLGVGIVPNTYLIHIFFSSSSATEAAEVVNQVVTSFQQANRRFDEGTNDALRRNYESYLKKLDDDIQQKQERMIRLAERIDRHVDSATDKVEKPRAEAGDVARSTSRADELKISFIRDELSTYYDMKNSVRRKLEQLQFDYQRGIARVEVVDSAAAARTPQSDSRKVWMMVLPPAVLVALIGYFLVLDAGFHSRTSAGTNLDLP